ncbi:hypothetical protein Pmani_038188 [Petrolisthes manimaculis]|uniref:Uncharacterized protein n=1 Tax=Petrolisthes manimaculis TaxID=1843537 RepID=A0AAE1NEX0_9EUCA|nr:hypothetical protein Pmani_038188 [Petrolisthes manimaculis]
MIFSPITEGVQQDSSSTTSPPEGPVIANPSDVVQTDSSSNLPILTTHSASLSSIAEDTLSVSLSPEDTTDVAPTEDTGLPSEINTATPSPDDPPTTYPAAPGDCPELQCLDGTCILVSQLNDGVNDCPSGTDEQDFGNIFP